VVNNAGIARPAPLRSLSLGALRARVRGPHRWHDSGDASRVAGPSSQRAWRGGEPTSEESDCSASPGRPATRPAKMAIVEATKVAALEGARHGIRVNAIAPMAHRRWPATSSGT
jgi:NAD(P)-dependent dehydrogenase (short-subunit alcohol dehydrogenase family)